MTRIIHAELLRLVRKRTAILVAAAAVLFAGVATLAVFASARDTGVRSRRQGTTLAALAGHGGGTEAFAVGASFTGFLVFVTMIALISGEFSGGTFRVLLTREPRRTRVLVGKVVGILLVAAATVALVELFTFVASLVVAPTKDVPTSEWFTLASVGDAVRDYGTALAGISGWAIFGTMLAVIFRSTPLALAVGFAWAGPFENITVDSWSTGYRVFPGQVLASLIQGGSAELGLGRALLTGTIYVAVAAAVALMLFTRRDITA
jgi:ABC-type transport system involved in multi-copper enzyme maturation permease subunit